jgi:hypothetical protein
MIGFVDISSAGGTEMRAWLVAATIGGIVLGLQAPAGKAQQPPASRDGTYTGSMTQAAQNLPNAESVPACVYLRAVNMKVAGGLVTVWYTDWQGNIIHYRGKLDGAGNVLAWHTNGDGTKSVLTGQFGAGGFTGHMERDRQLCPYDLALAPAPAR